MTGVGTANMLPRFPLKPVKEVEPRSAGKSLRNHKFGINLQVVRNEDVLRSTRRKLIL